MALAVALLDVTVAPASIESVPMPSLPVPSALTSAASVDRPRAGLDGRAIAHDEVAGGFDRNRGRPSGPDLADHAYAPVVAAHAAAALSRDQDIAGGRRDAPANVNTHFIEDDVPLVVPPVPVIVIVAAPVEVTRPSAAYAVVVPPHCCRLVP